MEPDLRAASSERQPGRPLRLLVATTPLPVGRLADVLSALLDSGTELVVDAILVLSRCALGGSEPDVIKASRVLGLPSIMLVISWDNLSSKAILNEHPDRLLVWNEVQVGEAVEQHGVEPHRVVALGA